MFETAEVRQSANLEGVYSTRNNPIRLDRQIDGRTGRAVNWNVFGSNGDDCVWCGDGDDTIWGIGGFDRIDAGNGRNTIYASVGGGVYSGGEDVDTFYMPEGNDRRNIFKFGGGWDNDVLYVDGDFEDDVFAHMGHQDDIVYGGKPKGEYWMGQGNDAVHTSVLQSKWGDFVIGGHGSDLLRVDAANPGDPFADHAAAHFGDFHSVGDRIEIENLGNRNWHLQEYGSRRNPSFIIRDEESRAIVKGSGIQIIAGRFLSTSPGASPQMRKRVVVAYDHNSLEVIESEFAVGDNVGFEFIRQPN